MSLILDALRKSEAERRRGQSPDLFAPSPMVTPRVARHGIQTWQVVIVIAAIALLAGVWWNLRANHVKTDESIASIPVLTEPKPAPTAAATVVAASTPAHHDDPSARSETAPALVAAKTAPTVAAAPVTPSTTPSAQLPPPIPPSASTSAATTNSDADEALPNIAALDDAQRSALPALKISMHVWSATPAQRFAIVDGQRVTEGSSLSGNIVSEIRRDGIVLDINGRRYLLPRP